MKKLLITLLFMFVTYVIYYDLSEGVLSTPTSIVLLQENGNKNSEKSTIKETEEVLKSENSHSKNEKKDEFYFKEVKVTSGQTVLSIVEQIQGGPLPVSISQLITDFQLLNPKTEPEMIQIGKVYKFPVYPETKQ